MIDLSIEIRQTVYIDNHLNTLLWSDGCNK